MNYYLDTEFLEGTQDKKFLGITYGQTKPTIDLISIGIVAEDGREYYAISKDFNLKEAWNRYQMKQVSGDARNRYPDGIKEYWIRENVLEPIFNEFYIDVFGVNMPTFNYKSFQFLIEKIGKTNKQIAKEIIKFTNDNVPFKTNGTTTITPDPQSVLDLKRGYTTPTFYAYFADYDWVVFCQLFGTMMDLPKGFPMYCKDLKQILDDKAQEQSDKMPDGNFEICLDFIENAEQYPKLQNEHNALEDAKWNQELHKFLNSL